MSYRGMLSLLIPTSLSANSTLLETPSSIGESMILIHSVLLTSPRRPRLNRAACVCEREREQRRRDNAKFSGISRPCAKFQSKEALICGKTEKGSDITREGNESQWSQTGTAKYADSKARLEGCAASGGKDKYVASQI